MGSSSSAPGRTLATARSVSVRTAAPVAAGDLLVIVGAILVGEVSHGISPVASPLLVLDTLVPFLVGWVLLAALLGAYDGAAVTARVASVRVGAGAWIGAANVGLILRASPLFHGSATFPFPLVITGVVLVGLVAWRAVAPAILARRARD